MPRVYYMGQSMGILLGMMGENAISETLDKQKVPTNYSNTCNLAGESDEFFGRKFSKIDKKWSGLEHGIF